MWTTHIWHMCVLKKNMCVLGHSHYILCSTDPEKGFSGLSEEIIWKIKKKTYSFAFVGEKTPQLQNVGGKKKIEQTSSKIDSTDHVFYSDDSVSACYVTCNNLQFIELSLN